MPRACLPLLLHTHTAISRSMAFWIRLCEIAGWLFVGSWWTSTIGCIIGWVLFPVPVALSFCRFVAVSNLKVISKGAPSQRRHFWATYPSILATMINSNVLANIFLKISSRLYFLYCLLTYFLLLLQPNI